jgi:hypothetical protein
MVMTDTELNEKLALKVGYTFQGITWGWLPPGIAREQSTIGDLINAVPNYTHDLNACIRDIKPLLIERGLTAIVFTYKAGHIFCDLHFGIPECSAVGATEALAFCEAAIKFLSEVK